MLLSSQLKSRRNPRCQLRTSSCPIALFGKIEVVQKILQQGKCLAVAMAHATLSRKSVWQPSIFSATKPIIGQTKWSNFKLPNIFMRNTISSTAMLWQMACSSPNDGARNWGCTGLSWPQICIFVDCNNYQWWPQENPTLLGWMAWKCQRQLCLLEHSSGHQSVGIFFSYYCLVTDSAMMDAPSVVTAFKALFEHAMTKQEEQFNTLPGKLCMTSEHTIAIS